MDKYISVKEVKELREIIGLGMLECKQLLKKFDNIDDIINYVRSTSDEPDKVGFTEPRVDVLDRYDNVICTFKTLDEAYENGFNSLKYRIRVVSSLGHYSYLK